jgi:hypothetical protein
MKLLQQYHGMRQAEIDALLLEQQGIVTHLSSRHSHSLSGFVTGVFSVGLWNVFDHQFENAKAFLEDNTHQVKSGFSAAELVDIQAHSAERSYKTLNQFLTYVIVGISAIICALSLTIYNQW